MRSTERNGPVGEVPVSVLGRATAVLSAFDVEHPVLGVSELARQTGLAKSTVHRLAAELVGLGLLDHDDGGDGYRLGMRLFELGELVPTHRSLSDAALPIMEDLRAATQARIHLAVLQGIDVVYVEILGGFGLDLASRTGGRLPAHATGVGKVMLAYAGAGALRARIDAGLPPLTSRTIATAEALTLELRKIRTVGFALDLEESTLGVCCVAAPVFGPDRKIAAALSVTGPMATFDPGTIGPAVRTAAFTLTRTLRGPLP